jgi:hypothetical protein
VTASNVAPNLVVLHPSAAAHWWLSSSLHEKAELLRRRLHTGAVRAFVLDDADVYITQAILRGLAGGLRLTAEARRLVEIDAAAEIARLQRADTADLPPALLPMPAAPLLERARPLAWALGIDEHDAAYIALAEALQRSVDCPLLLAERALHDRLHTQRPRLELLWLGNYG